MQDMLNKYSNTLTPITQFGLPVDKQGPGARPRFHCNCNEFGPRSVGQHWYTTNGPYNKKNLICLDQDQFSI